MKTDLLSEEGQFVLYMGGREGERGGGRKSFCERP
jgi:hypothetical protein